MTVYKWQIGNCSINKKVIFYVMTLDQWKIKEPYLYEQRLVQR